MAPRKNVKISFPEKKVDKLRGSRGKNKPPLKVSRAIITIIPDNKSSLDVPDTEKKLDSNTKKALADEVARAQILKEPIAVRIKPPVLKRQKKGQAKSTETELINLNTVKNEPEEESKPNTVLPTIKKSTKKNAGKIQSPKQRVTRKRVADSTMPKQAVKRQRKNGTPAVNTPVQENNTIIQENVSNIKTQEPQNVSNLKTPEPQNVSNLKTPEPQKVSNLKTPEPQNVSNPKTPEPQNVSNLKTPEPQNVLNLKTLEPQKVPKTNKSVPQNKIKIHTTENEMVWIGDTKNRKKTRKVNSNEVKLKEELTETTPKGDPLTKSCKTNKSKTSSPPRSSELSAPTLRKRLNRGKQDIALENLLQSIPEIPVMKSPQKLKSPNAEAEVKNNKSDTPKSLEVARLKTLRSRSKPLSNKPGQKTKVNISKGNITSPVNSRKNSMSSISNLSWTRDISSSSTATSVTVTSNNLVSIDKKIPLIKLTRSNVDGEIHKYKSKDVDTQDIANENNEDSNSSSSDDDSSYSDSESSPDYDSRITPSACTTVKVNSLHLSSPSRNSLVQNKIEEHDPNKKDFEKAAEKLTQALNNIDMQFINWMYDPDFATSDLSKIKANLFTIMNSEFSALKHCRHLQDISNPTRTKDNVIITNGPVVVENNIEEKKLETKTIESNSTEMNKTERNRDDPKTDTLLKLVNNESESAIVTEKNTEKEAVATKLLKINEPCKIISCRDKDSSPRNDRNITILKPIVETDQITRNIEENYPEEAFIKPSTSGCAVSSKVRRVSEFSDSDSENDDFTADVYANKLALSAHDDDDALSLFAESITGIESSKINASSVSTAPQKQIEEYIPKPKQHHFVTPPKPTYIYLPTKISDQGKIICEKQNADSTSIYKESNDLLSENKETASFTDSAESHIEVIPKANSIAVNSSQNVNKPCLLANLYSLKPKEHNVIFEGYCYFNLIQRCSSMKYGKPCRKSHDIPDERIIQNKLASLSTELLIKEYMLVRKNMHILRKYGMCFLFECIKRKLTRVIVEIAYDFIMKGDKESQIDDFLKVASVEVALLYLNEIDLSVCEDILKLHVGDSLLCEVFMQVMTRTQNFTRFKSVFLSLTYFMVNNDRTFTLEVAEQILERVCILPFDETVVRALIQIMRLTRSEIFLNTMIEKFEKLIRQHKDIFDEYILVKSEINIKKLFRQMTEQHQGLNDQPVHQYVEQPMMHQPVPQHLNVPSVDQPHNVEMREGVPLPPSPDTTHLDNINKKSEDHVTPKITRTIMGFRPTPNSQTPGVSPSSFNDEEETEQHHRNWKNRSIFQKIADNNFFPPRQTAPFVRFSGNSGRNNRQRPFKRRLVTLGRSPIGYPSPGQDF